MRYAMVIDQETCLGCHACAIACQVENDLSDRSFMRVESSGGRMDVPIGVYPKLSLSYFPISCMQCADAPCVASCATQALKRRDDGIVILTRGDCNGCEACVLVCPYDAIRVNPATGLAEKCTYCATRVDAGLEPFCKICCEGEAIYFGDLDDAMSSVSRLVAERAAFVLKPDENTDPATRYAPLRAKVAI